MCTINFFLAYWEKYDNSVIYNNFITEVVMKNICTIQAGEKAYAIIKDEGLQKERIKCMLGAAGGPKWIILYGLDKALYKAFLQKRKNSVYMIGSSIATWRFAALSLADGLQGIEAFKERYFAQQYSMQPDRHEITAETVAILEAFLPDSKVDEIVKHPTQRLCIITARSRHLLQYDDTFRLGAGLAINAITNVLSRKLVGLHFDRFAFYDAREFPSFIQWENYHTQYIPLNNNNLKTAVLASGSIPLVMNGVVFQHDGKTHILRDGGLVDYQQDLPLEPGDYIALYPHYSDRIIPGWFDKPLKYRKPYHALENVCMVSPSKEAIASLRYKKIPDRKDFYTFAGDDSRRLLFWNETVALGQQIAEEFMELVESGRIKDRVIPFKR